MNPRPLSPEQTSALDLLVSKDRLRVVPVDFQKTTRFIEQAREALLELPTIKTRSIRYDGAYNCAHDVAESLLAAYGFATTNGIGQHVTVGEALVIFFFGHEAFPIAEEFEFLRRERNQLRYVSHPIGSAQADRAINVSKDLLFGAMQILGAP